jgi:hypothetical protein
MEAEQRRKEGREGEMSQMTLMTAIFLVFSFHFSSSFLSLSL